MSISITISQTTYIPLDATIQIQGSLNQRSTCSFIIRDDTGTIHFRKGQQIIIKDLVTNIILFGGVIDSSKEQRLAPISCILSSVQCVDNNYFADKFFMTNDDYQNMYAGDIACDLLSTYLAREGITSSYAIENDHTQAQLAAHTSQSNTVATTNVGDGDLELSLAGAAVTKSETSTADFNSGTLSSMNTSNNQLQLNSRRGIMIAADCTAIVQNCFAYWTIWSGNYTIANGDFLTYKVWINANSPLIQSAMDGTCTDGTTLRDYNGQQLVDQNGIKSHPGTNLKGYADNQYYTRTVDLSPISGKVLNTATVAFEGDNQGHYAAYYYDCKIMNGTTTKQTLYANNGQLQTSSPAQDIGYANFKITTPLVYDQVGSRQSIGTSLTPVGVAKSGIVNWDAAPLPAGATMEIDASLDGGATWIACTNHGPLPGLIPGMSVNGLTISIQQLFTISGPDPTVTPILYDNAITVFPTFSATKSDVMNTVQSPGDFNNGNLNNISTIGGGGIELSGNTRDWDNGVISSQTNYGDNAPSHHHSNGWFWLASNQGEVHERFDFAGNGWKDFTLNVDVQIPPAGLATGILYRTTGWGNGNNTYAYVVDITTTTITLGKGTNNGSSTDSTYTQLKQFTSGFFTPAVGSWHTVTIIVSGSSHTVMMDGVAYISNFSDSSFTNAGYVGVHGYQSNNAAGQFYFDNFGISSSLTGSYTSQSFPISNAGIVYDSIINWDQGDVPGGATITVQTSIDGGNTWQTAINNAEIPGVIPGFNASTVNVKVKVTLTTPTAAVTPVFNAFTILVVSSFNSTGNRVGPSLNIANVGRIGSTSVSWNVVLPNSNTSMNVKTSIDGGSTYQSIPSSGGSIPNLVSEPSPIDDLFLANDISSYLNTFGFGGNAGSWTINTTNQNLTASGGAKALLMWNGVTVTDFDMYVDMTSSDSGGLSWREKDTSDYYEISIQDSLSSKSNQNALLLYKTSSGTRSQLGSTGTINFVRGTPHRIRVTMIANVITVYFDGQQVLTYTDASAIASGGVGMRTDGGSATFYEFNCQPYGQVSSGSVLTKVTLITTDPLNTPQLLQIMTSVRASGIDSGILVGQTNYKFQNTISKCFDDLCQQSGFWWDIDYNKVFSFQPPNGKPAPWIASSALGTMLLNNLTVTDMSPLYRNRQWVQGGLDTTAFTNSFVGNFWQNTFTCSYPLASLPTITVNGVLQTVGLKGGSGFQWYYAVGDAVVAQDPSQQILDPTQVVVISGLGQIQVTVMAEDTIEQTAYQLLEGGSGIVEDAETLQTLNVPSLNKAQAQALATSLLNFYKSRGKQISFVTMNSGLAVGQYLTVWLPEHGILDQQFLITDVSLTIQTNPDTSPLVFYTISCTSGPDIGDFTQLYSHLKYATII